VPKISPIEALVAALEKERAYRDAYGPASEPVAFEIARAADNLLMGDLLGFAPKGKLDRMELAIREWGINDAFARMIPLEQGSAPFRLFPSRPENQAQVDDFLFSCGAIRLGEKMLAWLREGLISGDYREHCSPDNDSLKVLVLTTADPSLGDEIVNRTWLRWEADDKVRVGRSREATLMVEFRRLEPQLGRMCSLIRGAFPVYDEAYALIDIFEGHAAHYLERMFGRDLFGLDDIVGGFRFRDYLAAIRVLSGMQHLHLAVFRILRSRHPSLDVRNLLAWPSSVEITVGLVSRRLDCAVEEAIRLLQPLTMSGENAVCHGAIGDPVWPALIRASRNTFIHPLFGLDVNPYLFLLANLRHDHRADWDRAANGREERWQSEFAELLDGSRYDQIRAKGLLLRKEGRHLTDVDFAAYDRNSGDLMLVQLKWQHPFDADDKARRSMARNLVEGGNQWTEAVMGWLTEHSAEEMVKRLGFALGASPQPRLFVLARYGAQFSGRADRDGRATWTSWPHFKKAWRHASRKSACDLACFIRRDTTEAKRRHNSVATTFKVGDLGVLLNPLRAPTTP
jgi:hypothetical protein